MILRKLRNIFLSFLAVFLILLASISALVETETGSRWVIKRLASLVDIRVGKINGDLRTGLDLEFIDYTLADQQYRAEQVSFRWKPAALLYSTLSIQSLQAKKLFIQIPVAAEEKSDPQSFSQWPSLALPIRIQLDQLLVTNIDFIQGETKLHWQKLSGSLSLGTFNLRYNNLALLHDDYALYLSGITSLRFPYGSKAELQWQWQPMVDDEDPDAAPALGYMGVTELNGNLHEMQLHNQISLPMVLTADAKVQLINEKQELQTTPIMNLVAEWQQQSLPAQWWIPEQPQPILNGKLTASGHWQQYSAQLDGNIHLPDAPALAVTAAVDGGVEQVHISNLFIRELHEVISADTSALVSATIDSAADSTATNSSSPNIAAASATATKAPLESGAQGENGLRLTGDVRWLPTVEWQINADAKKLNLASLIENWPSNINLAFDSQGTLQDGALRADVQNLNASGELRGVNLQASGNVFLENKTLRSDALNVIVGANRVQVNGSIGDTFHLDWVVNVPLLQQLDERVSGSVFSNGELRGDKNKPRVQMQAKMENVSFGSFGVDQLDLSLVPKSVADALAEQSAANKTINKNTKQNDQAAAKKSIEPQATASQTTDQQEAEVNALNKLVAELSDEGYLLAFNAKQLRLAQNRFSTIKVDGAGSINKHEFSASVKNPTYGNADLKLAGGYREGEWLGKLTQFSIKAKKIPRWWLTSSKPIKVNADAVTLGAQCFTTRTNLTGIVEDADLLEREQLVGEWNPNQSPVKSPYGWLDQNQQLPSSGVKKYSLPQLCLDGEWVKESGATANAKLDSIPLRQFLSFFKVEVFFAGVMDGAVHYSSKDFSLATTQLTSNISTRNAELRYQYAGGTTEVYAWRNFGVRATLKKSIFDAVATMEWVGYGTINANANLDLAQQKIVDGKVLMQFDNLAPLETVLPYANDVKGDFRADLTAGGTFAKPYVLGNISLHNGTANLPRLGLDLTNMELDITSTQAGDINVMSRLQSGDGTLSLVGDINKIGTPDWSLQGFLNGTNVKVVSLPQLKATLSPDIKVTANASTMNLSGSAIIPWARANIKRLPESATQVSSDAVIINDQGMKKEESVVDTAINLKLSLGNDVQFKGFGLNSKLSGELSLQKEPQRQFFTSGYVSVVDGSYKAYGQALKIDRGRLVFQGSYENPGLDIRASRIIKAADDAEVGLDITGTLQRPVAHVYSVPSDYSESQAMMMLMTGKPAGEMSKADASVLLGAMGGLGMDSDGGFTSGISQLFHLDELEINSDDGIEQSQLWIGKYLTPKLLVRYVVGIFDRAFSVGMEYQLTKHLRLEAESGEAQSVDIVYKIER